MAIVGRADTEEYPRWCEETRRRPAPLSYDWLGDLMGFAEAEMKKQE